MPFYFTRRLQMNITDSRRKWYWLQYRILWYWLQYIEHYREMRVMSIFVYSFHITWCIPLCSQHNLKQDQQYIKSHLISVHKDTKLCCDTIQYLARSLSMPYTQRGKARHFYIYNKERRWTFEWTMGHRILRRIHHPNIGYCITFLSCA